ncbi:MAG: CCA tRNA nucleotidyltransferase [Clostridium butyricum]
MRDFILPKKVKQIINTIEENGFEAYVVGGCVRDTLLGREPKDWDITTSALPEDIMKIFPSVVPTGIQHGTVTVMLGKDGYEVTTYRIDGEYEDGRHPNKVIFTRDIVKDLARRDFTINAMAYNPKVGLIDIFGGQKDLKNKTIRCVGNPKTRFEEDYLRIMRAYRFATQLGFNIDFKTKCLITELCEESNNILSISKERIREELNKILLSSNNATSMGANSFFFEKNLIGKILPELVECRSFRQNNPHHHLSLFGHTIWSVNLIEPQLPLKLTMLLHDLGKLMTKTTDEKGISHYIGHAAVSKSIAERWLKEYKYDNKTIDKALILIEYHDSLSASRKSVKKLLSKIGEENFRDLLKVRKADILAQNPHYTYKKISELIRIKKLLYEVISNKEPFSIKNLAINGNDIMKLGVPQGRIVGDMLSKCLEYVLENPSKNNKEDLIKYVKGMM